MPHFKCPGCRTRQYSAARPSDLIGDLCPGCGSPLEPVGNLAEIVGFQLIEHRDSAADGFATEALARAIALPIPPKLDGSRR